MIRGGIVCNEWSNYFQNKCLWKLFTFSKPFCFEKKKNNSFTTLNKEKVLNNNKETQTSIKPSCSISNFKFMDRICRDGATDFSVFLSNVKFN